MERAYSVFSQSRFFTTAFNSAIYDGPVRIYFHQSHESAGLNVYFSLVKNHPEMLRDLKERSKLTGENLYVLIYPEMDSYKLIFESADHSYSLGHLEQHTVVGIRSAQELEEPTSIIEDIVKCVEAMPRATVYNEELAEQVL